LFSKNVVFKGLSCLLLSRFCDRALLLVVCEVPWRFGFWFPALLPSLSLLLSAARESISNRTSRSFDFLRSGVCAEGRVRVLVGRGWAALELASLHLFACFFTFV
jgi:hypothetical protein